MKIGIKTRASALIFEDGKVMVTKHDVPDYGVYYLLPGGGIELGESPEDALKREVKEECGIDIEVHRLVYYKSGYTDKDNYLDLIFLCKKVGRDIKVSEDEKNVKEVQFVTPNEIKELKFFPKQLIGLDLLNLPEQATFLGKFQYPED
ncbi:hypothetical protein COY00_00390 [Candidatus Pacearchaeota archaeon CG_4_10_14_0_2_um_filter_35_33]|nr:MAG: hypothetical protein COY79_04195 [Candidatus Pacearchaeota archaeon CG_4_10_14_0_8_um_filter_35_169]PIZ80789.1 MAG: hypothetical protein COY00_00390 [Candidatus Pacearchaeota archaeon CG_4_10_14_0_2_um_filter_35_33]PJA69622.1 MAG: hypothetical protein CO155_04295 [Candidatus Pacearchaeota archaeon CG_4_9_14_3_um_filter_35_19]